MSKRIAISLTDPDKPITMKECPDEPTPTAENYAPPGNFVLPPSPDAAEHAQRRFAEINAEAIAKALQPAKPEAPKMNPRGAGRKKSHDEQALFVALAHVVKDAKPQELMSAEKHPILIDRVLSAYCAETGLSEPHCHYQRWIAAFFREYLRE